MAWRAPGQACCVSLSLSEAPGIKTKRECVRVCMRINTRGSPSHTHLTRMSHRRSILPYCHSGTHRSAVCVCVCVCGQRIQVCVCVCVYEREREWQNVCNPLDTAAEEQVYWWKHWSQQKAGPPIAPAQLSVSAFQLPSLTLPLSRSLFRTHSRSGGVLSRHPTPPPPSLWQLGPVSILNSWWWVWAGSEGGLCTVLTPVDRFCLHPYLSLAHLQWFT